MGLGNNTNNQVEVLAVYMGMQLILADKFARILVIGDSEMIIKGLRRLNKNAHPNLMQIYQRIMNMEQKFNSVSYYHIYRR
jgi:ribonuclease HI